jgi:hypothetical protein
LGREGDGLKSFNNMKNTFKKIIVLFFLMVSPLLIGSVFADEPPAPGTGAGGGSPVGAPGAGPVGGGAPIDGGFSILLVMGAIYGGSKVYKAISWEKQVS